MFKKLFGSSRPAADIAALEAALAQVRALAAQRDFPAAIDLARATLAQAEQQLDPDHALLGLARNHLATLYGNTGRYAEALPLQQALLEVVRRNGNHANPIFPNVARALVDLYRNLGRPADAALLLGELITAKPEPDQPAIIAMLLELGELAVAGDQIKLAQFSLQRLAALRPGLDPAQRCQMAIVQSKVIRQTVDLLTSRIVLEQSLKQIELDSGPAHPALIPLLDELATTYENEPDPAPALPLYLRISRIQLAHPDKQYPRAWMSLMLAAQFALAQGRHAERASLLRATLRNMSATGADAAALAVALTLELAQAEVRMGNAAAAEPLARQALAAFRASAGPESLEAYAALGTLITCVHDQGRFDEVMRLCAEAEQCGMLRAEHPDTVAHLSLVAGIQRQMGDAELAIELYECACALAQRVLGPTHPIYAQALVELGNCHAKHSLAGMDRYMTALGIYLEILPDPSAAPEVQTVLYAMSIKAGYPHYTHIKGLEDILEQARRSMAPDDPRIIEMLKDLAAVHTWRGECDLAVQRYQQALELGQADGRDQVGRLETMIDLAEALAWAGRPAEAEEALKDALMQCLGQPNPDPRPFSAIFNQLGMLAYTRGETDEAEACIQQAIAFKPASSTDASYEDNLALIYLAEGRAAEALPLSELVLAAAERARAHMFANTSAGRRIDYWMQRRPALDVLIAIVAGHLAHDPSAVASGFNAVLRLKGSQLELLAAQRASALHSDDPTVQAHFTRLNELTAQFNRAVTAGPGAAEEAGYQEQFGMLGMRRELLEMRLASTTASQPLPAIDAAMVARALPGGSALVEIIHYQIPARPHIPTSEAWSDDRLAAFVLRAGQPAAQVVDLGSGEVVAPLVAEFRAAITGEHAEVRHMRPYAAARPAAPSAGDRLRALVFDPLLPALGGCTRLFIAPDAAVSRLPFEALPLADGRYLLDAYEISYVPTARSILRFGQPAPAEPGPPLVVADPNYDLHLTEPASDAAETPAKVGLLRQAGVRFNRLRGTRAEGERIAELLGVRPLLGAAALEEPMKAARSPQILHIATHGFFLAAHEQDLLAPGLRRLGGSVGDSALVRSGLALAGANTRLRGGALPPEAGDAILNGLDVAAMDLGATRLVVLSACETGLGELESGEGVFGLSRTFMQAGARTLVLSLWKVPDAQTQELMVDFYQQLLAGAPVSGALRAAQQRLKMRYPDPLYWAGFICQGDPGPITGQAP